VRILGLNLLLAAIWAAFSGSPNPRGLAFGFVLGYLVLWWLAPLFADATYHGRVWRALVFLVLYAWDFTRASLRVAYDVLTPRLHMTPGVIRLPLDARSNLEITVLANLLSLTPGTLSLDVSRDRQSLFLHAMYIDRDDADDLRHAIKTRLERRVLSLLRGPAPREDR
jgi:multicomponent Na+:H+ antiporter subunit E